MTHLTHDKLAEWTIEECHRVDERWRDREDSAGMVFEMLSRRIDHRGDSVRDLEQYVRSAARKEAQRFHEDLLRRTKFDHLEDPSIDHRRGRACAGIQRYSPLMHSKLGFDCSEDLEEETRLALEQFHAADPFDQQLLASVAKLPGAPSLASLARMVGQSRQNLSRKAKRCLKKLQSAFFQELDK